MAERAAGGGKGEARKPSDFIAALVKDPKNPPEVVEVTGFIGAAVEQGRTRIYLDTTLQNHVEVMEDKILHVEPVAEGQLGLSHIFIAADAQIFMPEVEPKLDARSMFGGAVYQDYLTAAGGGVPGISAAGQVSGAAITHYPSLIVICQSITPNCQSLSAICHSIPYYRCHTLSNGIFCHSLQLSCTYIAIRCPTRHPVQCTYHPLICVGLQTPELTDIPQPYAGMAAMGRQAAINPQAAQYAQAAMGPQVGPAPWASVAVICPSLQITCPTRLVVNCPNTLYPPRCPPRTFSAPWCPPSLVQPWCVSLQIWQCPTRDPINCPRRTWPPICAAGTLPGQCDFGGWEGGVVDPGPLVNPGAGMGGYYDPYAPYQTGY